MSLRKLRNLKAKVKSRDGFWIEKLKLDFTKALTAQLERKKIKKAELARKLDLSAPYITKVMRGDENLTIESMVRLSRAAGGRLHLHISDENSDVSWIECNARNSFRELISGFDEDEYRFDGEHVSVLRSGGNRERGDVAA
jgi:transcriptional regulator with XRE-family HTH domain